MPTTVVLTMVSTLTRMRSALDIVLANTRNVLPLTSIFTTMDAFYTAPIPVSVAGITTAAATDSRWSAIVRTIAAISASESAQLVWRCAVFDVYKGLFAVFPQL